MWRPYTLPPRGGQPQGADARATMSRRQGFGCKVARMAFGQRRQWIWIMLVAIFVLAVGHVCVLPDHAHAMPAHHGGGTHHDATSVHAASCQAVAASPPSVYAPTLALVEPLAAAASPRVPTRAVVALEMPNASPPALFLLHSALLI